MSLPPPSLTLHGVFLRVEGIGVLLTGDSGVGKSELALELLARGHELVADDAAEFRLARGCITGYCPPLLQGFLEARALGILNIRKLFGAQALRRSHRLHLIIRLDAPCRASRHGLERLSGTRGTRNLLGLEVPELYLAIRLGHNLAALVEAAARDQKLRMRGYSADEDFMARQLQAIRRTQKKP